MVGGSWVSLADVKDKVGGEFALLYDNPAACMLLDYDLRCLVEGGHRQQGTGPTYCYKSDCYITCFGGQWSRRLG